MVFFSYASRARYFPASRHDVTHQGAPGELFWYSLGRLGGSLDLLFTPSLRKRESAAATFCASLRNWSISLALPTGTGVRLGGSGVAKHWPELFGSPRS